MAEAHLSLEGNCLCCLTGRREGQEEGAGARGRWQSKGR